MIHLPRGESGCIGRFPDLKWCPAGNHTLNAVFNPDFGQVEVDPAVVNLSDFETFFPERRPFAVKDANTFNYAEEDTNSN